MRKRLDPDTEKALRESEEHARITAALPTRKQLAEELGPFKTCTTPTYVEEADGTSQVNITDEKAAPEENRKRWAVYVEASSESRAIDIVRSERRNAERGEVIFHDERTGEVRATTPEREDHIARKKWARPGRSRRTYFTGGWLGR